MLAECSIRSPWLVLRLMTSSYLVARAARRSIHDFASLSVFEEMVDQTEGVVTTTSLNRW